MSLFIRMLLNSIWHGIFWSKKVWKGVESTRSLYLMFYLRFNYTNIKTLNFETVS